MFMVLVANTYKLVKLLSLFLLEKGSGKKNCCTLGNYIFPFHKKYIKHLLNCQVQQIVEVIISSLTLLAKIYPPKKVEVYSTPPPTFVRSNGSSKKIFSESERRAMTLRCALSRLTNFS